MKTNEYFNETVTELKEDMVGMPEVVVRFAVKKRFDDAIEMIEATKHEHDLWTGDNGVSDEESDAFCETVMTFVRNEALHAMGF